MGQKRHRPEQIIQNLRQAEFATTTATRASATSGTIVWAMGLEPMFRRENGCTCRLTRAHMSS